MLYLVNPILKALRVPIVEADMADLWPVITGILGLGGMRTYEKKVGKAGIH
jgi:hypothetical protein